MEASFGIVQLKKFKDYLKAREEVASFFTEKFDRYSDFLVLPKARANTRPAWFAYPILVKESSPFKREDLTSFLEEKGIETRPIMAGNFTKQPVAKLYDFEISGDLKNTDYIHRNGFFIGAHAGIGDNEREYVAEVLQKFFENI